MRTREWPLVPAKLAILTPGPCEDNVEWMRERCKFVPNLDPRHCPRTSSSEKEKQILSRAKELSGFSKTKLANKVSEDHWEQDINAKVCVSIRDDKRPRIEKKHCDYLLQADKQKHRMKERVPDQTFGPASFNDMISTDRRGGLCDGPAQTSSLPEVFPSELLKSRLPNQVYCSSTGLIVDGLWGDSTLRSPGELLRR